MPIMTNSGRAALAAALASQALHLAWGTGDPAWDDLPDPPPEPPEQTALTHEIGRRKVTGVSFVTPDPLGTIAGIDETGLAVNFTPSETPTNYLFIVTNFDFGEAPASTIREIGLFMGTVTDPGLPPGQMYFDPVDIVSPGTLVALENIVASARSPGKKQTYEFVMQI
jgi:hypothetical protein